MSLRSWRRALASPSLSASAVHAPVALVPGRTPLHVRATGSGVLRVGRARRLVWGGLDEVVLADVEPGARSIEVGFRGRAVRVPLVPLPAPRPVVVHVTAPAPAHAAIAVPALRVELPPFAIPLPVLEESP